MTDEMRSKLEELGYSQEEQGNYWFEGNANDAATIQRTAGLLARTLHEVYGASPSEQLSITVDS